MMQKLLFFFNQYRLLFYIILTVLSIGMLIYIIFNISLEQDITKLIPKGDEAITEYFDIVDKLGLMDKLLIDLSIEADFNTTQEETQALINVADHFVNLLQETDHFSNILYRFDDEKLKHTAMQLFDRRFNLIPIQQYPETSFYNEEYLKSRLSQLKMKLFLLDTFISRETLLNDPFGFTEAFIQNMMNQKVDFKFKMNQNILFSEDNHHILLITTPIKPSFDIEFGQQLIEDINAIANDISQNREYQVQIKMLGGHLYAVSTASLIKQDITLIFILSSLGVLCIYFFSFRKLRILFYSFLQISFGLITGVFFITLLFESVHGTTLAFGAMLIGICIDYSTHYFIAYSFHMKNKSAYPNLIAIQEIARSLFIGFLSTVIIGIVFLFSDFRFLYEIAVFFFAGISAAFFISLFIIPQIDLSKGKGIQVDFLLVKAKNKINSLMQWSKKHWKTLLILAIIITAQASLMLGFIRFDTDIRNFGYVQTELRQIEEEFYQRYGDITTTNMIVISGENRSEILELNDKVYHLLNEAKQKGYIDDFYNIHVFLPSRTTQLHRLEHFQSIDWGRVKNRFLTLAPDYGFEPSDFQAFFQEMEAFQTQPKEWITLEDYQDTAFYSILDKVLFKNKEEIILLSYFKAREEQYLSQVIQQINSIDEKVHYVNQINIINQIMDTLTEELARMGGIVFILMFIILIIQYRNIKKPLLAIMPSVFGIIVAVALISLIYDKLNIVNIFAMMLIVGIGLDYGVFLVNCQRVGAYNDQEATDRTALAIIISALTTLVSFGILIISKNPVLSSIGIVILLGIFFAMLFTVILVPSLMNRFVKPPSQTEG